MTPTPGVGECMAVGAQYAKVLQPVVPRVAVDVVELER